MVNENDASIKITEDGETTCHSLLDDLYVKKEVTPTQKQLDEYNKLKESGKIVRCPDGLYFGRICTHECFN